jgi:transcriptional repressor NrdR
MHCPYCGSPDSKVTDSRDTGEGIRRRRECAQCGVRFTTYERIQGASLMVVKRDDRREEYNRDKLLRSIRLACTKRPLPTGSLDKIIDDIENALQQMGRAEVSAHVIGEIAMSRLRNLDRVAYIRFASVYRDFKGLDEFQSEIHAVQQAEENVQPEPTSSQLLLIPNEVSAPQKPRVRRGRKPGVSQPRIPLAAEPLVGSDTSSVTPHGDSAQAQR